MKRYPAPQISARLKALSFGSDLDPKPHTIEADDGRRYRVALTRLTMYHPIYQEVLYGHHEDFNRATSDEATPLDIKRMERTFWGLMVLCVRDASTLQPVWQPHDVAFFANDPNPPLWLLQLRHDVMVHNGFGEDVDETQPDLSNVVVLPVR